MDRETFEARRPEYDAYRSKFNRIFRVLRWLFVGVGFAPGVCVAIWWSVVIGTALAVALGLAAYELLPRVAVATFRAVMVRRFPELSEPGISWRAATVSPRSPEAS